MEGLSNDILELILRQLEDTSEIEKCLKTCLKWRHIIDWISENLISCPFDGCSVKVTKIKWKDMDNHKNYCIHDPEFQRLLELLQDFDNIQETDGFILSCNFDVVTGLTEVLQVLGPVKEWHDSVNPQLRQYFRHTM